MLEHLSGGVRVGKGGRERKGGEKKRRRKKKGEITYQVVTHQVEK